MKDPKTKMSVRFTAESLGLAQGWTQKRCGKVLVIDQKVKLVKQTKACIKISTHPKKY